MYCGILPLAFHSPGVAFIAIALLLSIASFGFIALGASLLANYGGDLSSKGKAVFLLIPAVLLASSPIIGYYATFPFGLLAGIIFMALIGPGDDSWIYLVGGCLLNTLGIYGVLALFRKRLSLRQREY